MIFSNLAIQFSNLKHGSIMDDNRVQNMATKNEIKKRQYRKESKK